MASYNSSSSSGYSTSHSTSSSQPNAIQTPQSEWGLALSQMLAALGQYQYAWAQNQFNNGMQVTDQQINNYMALAGAGAGLAQNLLGRYENVFEPLMNQYIQEAGSYNSADRQKFMMGQAESTAAQADQAAIDSAQRNLQSFGVNPNSGRYQDLLLTSRLQDAATRAGAGTQASVNTANIGRQMLQTAAQMGQNIPGMTVNALQSAYTGVTGAENALLGMLNTGTNMTNSAANFENAAANANRLPPVGQTSTSNGVSNSKNSGGSSGHSTDPQKQQQNPQNPSPSRNNGGGSGSGQGNGQNTGQGGGDNSNWISLPPGNGAAPGDTGQVNDFGGTDFGNATGPADVTGTQFGPWQDPNAPGSGASGMGPWPDPNATTPNQGNYTQQGGGQYNNQGNYFAPANQSYPGAGNPNDSGGYYGPGQGSDQGGASSGGSSGGSTDSGGYYGGGYARGGAVGQGVIPNQTSGGFVPPSASPSGGRQTDDIPARLNAKEFVMPRDVVEHLGTKHFHDLITKSRAARGAVNPPAQGKMKPALRMRPTFTSYHGA